MDRTYLDELVEYPPKAIQLIGTNHDIVKLLTNNPNIDMDSDEADAVFDNYIYDYTYVDRTSQESGAYIEVEAEMLRPTSPTVKAMAIYVTVLCHKDFMKLDPTLFPGFTGNRRDNITRIIDSLLNGSDIFGIGCLKLSGVKTVNGPNGYTGRVITYSMPEFKSRANPAPLAPSAPHPDNAGDPGTPEGL